MCKTEGLQQGKQRAYSKANSKTEGLQQGKQRAYSKASSKTEQAGMHCTHRDFFALRRNDLIQTGLFMSN